MCFDFRSTPPIERPIMKIRGNGRTPNLQATNLNTRIVQVDDILRHHPANNIGMGIFQKEIVITRNKDFMTKFEATEPIQEILHFDRMPPFANVTRMDNQVALWQFQFTVLA